MPPKNHGRAPTMSGEDQGTIPSMSFLLLHLIFISPFVEMNDGDPQSNNVSHKRGQFQTPAQGPFQPGFLSQMGILPGSHISVNSPNIQQMSPDAQRQFEQLMKSVAAQTQPRIPPNSSQNRQSNYPNNVELPNSMNTGMANLSINDRAPSGDSSNSQDMMYLSPPATFSRNKSDPQIALPDPMGSSNLSPYSNALQHSRSNPSLAPHMQEPAMANFFPQPVPTQQFHANGSQPSSTSPFTFPAGGPNFNTIYGNVTKHDDTVHNTNIDSFNTQNTTIQDSFNDNSFHSSGTGL